VQTVDKLVTVFGYPAELYDFKFDWRYMTRGLIIDKACSRHVLLHLLASLTTCCSTSRPHIPLPCCSSVPCFKSDCPLADSLTHSLTHSLTQSRGNVIKVDRHKYVKLAYHGFARLDSDARDSTYNRAAVRDDFEEPRYAMIDTLFSLAEAHLFMALVELEVR
jgi:hypothetical protein